MKIYQNCFVSWIEKSTTKWSSIKCAIIHWGLNIYWPTATIAFTHSSSHTIALWIPEDGRSPNLWILHLPSTPSWVATNDLENWLSYEMGDKEFYNKVHSHIPILSNKLLSNPYLRLFGCYFNLYTKWYGEHALRMRVDLGLQAFSCSVWGREDLRGDMAPVFKYLKSCHAEVEDLLKWFLRAGKG